MVRFVSLSVCGSFAVFWTIWIAVWAIATCGTSRLQTTCLVFNEPQEVKLEDADKYDEWEISRVNHEMAERQEKAMVKEFRERLLLNMGKVCRQHWIFRLRQISAGLHMLSDT